MNGYTFTGSPEEESHCPLQDVALLAGLAQFLAQLGQLRQLLAGQAVRTAALIQISLFGPRSHRCLSQVQVTSDAARSVAGLAY
jgi:hypothetical protein